MIAKGKGKAKEGKVNERGSNVGGKTPRDSPSSRYYVFTKSRLLSTAIESPSGYD